MNNWVSIYAAIIATFVAFIQFNQWRKQHVVILLTVSPRKIPCSHIKVNIDAIHNPISIRNIYIAAYKKKWHWLIRRKPNEVVGNEWYKMFPIKIEPGDGWEGLWAINDQERALIDKYNHVRLVVRHTGYGRLISRPITKYLRT